jgi:glyoxylase-like metal-dependent hydrolase (beta-lactamase superfamily II)
MARRHERHPENVAGPWYVDTRCIDCDVARLHAPGLIGALADGQSVVIRQPATAEEEHLMWRAALACPTRSIGTLDPRPEPTGVFPWEVTPGVLLCGHNDRRSFGAHSWFVPRPAGGLLIDAPHWSRDVVDSAEARGGIAHVLLTHQDDIADAQRYADHFDARVWIGEPDRQAAPFATELLSLERDSVVAAGVTAIPMAGHTRGSVLYLVDERWLFTGDSFAWFVHRGGLGAFREQTWYSWDALRASLDAFARSTHTFEWVLPGHGMWHGARAQQMQGHLDALVAQM